MAKLTLQSAQRLRRVTATAFDTFRTMSTMCAIIMKIQEEFSGYVTTCQAHQTASEDGRHGLGTPASYLWVALLEALAEIPCAIGNTRLARDLSSIKVIQEIVADMEMKQIQMMCGGIFVTKIQNGALLHVDLSHAGTYQEETSNATLRIRDLVHRLLEAANLVFLPGSAPMGFLEQRLSDMVRQLER